MKSSVLAVLMLLMVLSFGLNALAAAISPKAVDAQLKRLIPAGQPGLFVSGLTEGGRDCEASISLAPNGDVGVMVSARSMMGTRHYSFQSNQNRTVNSASANGAQLIVNSTTNAGVAEQMIISLDERSELKSVEMIEESSGFFGTSMKSLVKCSL